MAMPKKNLNQQLLAQFSGNDSFLTIPKIYYRLTKNLNKSLLLSQVIFYSDKSTYCKDGWFYKTYEDWQKEVFLSVRGMRDLFKELVSEELIEMRVAKIQGTRTPLFRPRLDNVAKAIEALLLSEIEPVVKPIIEQELSQTAESAFSVKNVPKRQKVPNSQTAESAVSNIHIQITTSDKKTTTSKKSGGGSFSKTKKQMLEQKLPDDERPDEKFLEHCTHHIKHNSPNPADSDYKKTMMLIALLKILAGRGEHFKSKGFVDLQEEKRQKEEQAARHKAQLAAQDKQHEEYLARMQKVSENKKSAMTNDQRRVGMSKCSSILEKLVGVQHANA
jgi:hypothetical protein